MHTHHRQNATLTGLSGGSEVLFNPPHRFTFNGKESDTEVKGEGNSLDFGARVYDPRLGRWFSVDPLRGLYTSITAFSYAGNCPLLIMDKDGKVLVDQYGNILYTTNGNPVKTSENYSSSDSKIRTVTYKQDVMVYANDGTAIRAYRIFKVDQIYTDVEVYNNKGEVIGKKKDWVDVKTRSDDDAYDCHGYTMLNGKFWLDGSEMNKLLEHDGYLKNQGGGDDINESNIMEPGKIAVYKANNDRNILLFDDEIIKINEGSITHSAITKGDGTLNTKNGSMPFGNNTNTELEKLYDSKGCLYNKEQNRIVQMKGKNNEKGAREVSKKKIDKVIIGSN
jgi:RHS repeat-associated protein